MSVTEHAAPAEFASVATAAAILDCSEKVIRAEITRGRLPSYRVGRLVRIRLADIERLRAPTYHSTKGST